MKGLEIVASLLLCKPPLHWLGPSIDLTSCPPLQALRAIASLTLAVIHVHGAIPHALRSDKPVL